MALNNNDIMSENKFTIKQAEITVSNKISSKPQRPSLNHIDITFSKESEVAFFSYITLQNFYTYAITIK